jgi:hypothetical protein
MERIGVRLITRIRATARGAGAAGLVAGLAACGPLALGGETQVAQAADACGAEPLQGLVGTSVGDLEAETLPEPRRVIFPGMAVTQDFVPERLNVEIGSGDEIERVYCG